jgi:hypothetical protein
VDRFRNTVTINVPLPTDEAMHVDRSELLAAEGVEVGAE